MTNPNQINGQITNKKIRNGGYIFFEDIQGRVNAPSFPNGISVCAIRVDQSSNSLTLHLLSRGDEISLEYITTNNGVRSTVPIADSIKIFSVLEDPEGKNAMIGLLVSDEQKQLLYATQKDSPNGQFVFNRPRDAE